MDDGGPVDACVPSAELCNGMDDDCDLTTPDESNEGWFGDACDGGDVDSCREGNLACAGGVTVCSDTSGDSAEVCDGTDDEDCEETVDGGC